ARHRLSPENDRGGAVGGADVLYDVAIRDLALPALVPAQLAHRLGDQRPALHVGFGMMAAAGVGRQAAAAELERAVADELSALAARAEAHALEREDDRGREIVVDHQPVDGVRAMPARS